MKTKGQSETRTHPFSVRQMLSEALALESYMIEKIGTLVQIESSSTDKVSVDRAVALVASWSDSLGGQVKLHRQRKYGDSLEVRFGSSCSRQPPIMVLGHLDTVWEKGALSRMPWKVSRDRIMGPGVLDMKAGVVMALSALKILTTHRLLKRPVVLLLHGDEEVGSYGSRPLTEAIARKCSAVYVLEPAEGDLGDYKTARKGVGQYRLTVCGVPSHSGVEFARGHSAIIELARQIEHIQGFTDLKRGITVNPGVIGGGSRPNVVAAEAWAEIDFRVERVHDATRLERAFRRLQVRDKSCSLKVSGGLNRPPMERTSRIVSLFRRAQNLAAEMGFGLNEASTGGGSDGSFTAALGIPTLDGMGAVGSGSHATDEHLLRKHLATRTALLAGMLL